MSLGGIVGILASMTAALWLNLAGIPDSGVLDRNNISKETDRAYVTSAPGGLLLIAQGDTPNSPTRSTMRLFEDGIELQPHTLHAKIREKGHGTFSHWESYVYFSAVDESDPRSNGRTYSFKQRLFLRDGLTACIILMGLFTIWPSLWSRLQRLPRLTRPATTRQAAFQYCCLFFVSFVALALLTSRAYPPPSDYPALGADNPLGSRVNYYLRHADRYSVIFLGDSQTYCAIHPELIERYLPSMNGLNLSIFTNWFPTQYSMLRRIIATIPKNTVVVWSITAANFSDQANLIQRVYPISLDVAPRLLWWGRGRTISGLFDNISYYHSGLHLPIALQELHARIDHEFMQPIPALASSTASSSAEKRPTTSPDQGLSNKIEFLRIEALRDPGVVGATVTIDNGKPTSVIRYFERGGYYRTELDPQFFRRKQAEDGLSSYGEPDRLLWTLFTRMLDMFAENGIKLVVNELREAPHKYKDRAARDTLPSYMAQRVRPEVEKHGFTYVRLDTDFSDDDYFDYNHMNSKGATKYAPLIAAVVSRQMSR